MPTTSGTVTCFGPDETTSVTVESLAASAPAPGWVRITRPAATSLLASSVFATRNPASTRRCVASTWSRPDTSGTATGAGPAETTRVTGLLGSTRVPAGG